jgi:predicted house-cleaning noncanonical NTP pyrophosphatase (MazG superfamily)
MTGEGILVRDCMRERIHAVTPYVRPVEGYAERVLLLRKKLLEEATEAALATSREQLIEELADVVQVVMDLAEAVGAGVSGVELARVAKYKDKGGFAAGIVLAWRQPPTVDSAP